MLKFTFKFILIFFAFISMQSISSADILEFAQVDSIHCQMGSTFLWTWVRFQLVYNQIDNEFRYDLVINNPNKVMKDIIAMCYVDADYEEK